MKHLLWLITLPLTVIVVVFAIANRHGVEIDLWPFEASLEVPLFLILLLSLLVGLIAGGAIAWLSAGAVRGRARRERMRAEFLELENRRLQQLANENKPTDKTPKIPALPAA